MADTPQEPRDEQHREMLDRRDALLLRKLEAEVAESEARALKAQLDLAGLRREQDRQLASPDEARIYPFMGPVNEESVRQAIFTLSAWSRRWPGEQLTVVFNSTGGLVLEGLALFDTMLELREKGHQITTVVRGQAASMGGVLLQGGTERVIGPNAYLLIHQVSAGTQGTLPTMEDAVAFNRQLQDRMLDILAERSSLSKAKIASRWQRKDWWLNAAEAVAYGFADRIG